MKKLISTYRKVRAFEFLTRLRNNYRLRFSISIVLPLTYGFIVLHIISDNTVALTHKKAQHFVNNHCKHKFTIITAKTLCGHF